MYEITRSLMFNEKLLLAIDASTNPLILGELAKDSDFRIRRAVSANPTTPDYAIDYLAHDIFVDIRISAKHHHNVTKETLRTLQDDPNPFVRYA